MIRKLLLVAALIFLSMPQYALGNGVQSSQIKLTAAQLKAMATALDRFRGDGNRIDNYYALVDNHPDGIEIVFVPELVKSSNMIGFEKSTKSEIHYYLDATGLKIIKVLLGQ